MADLLINGKTHEGVTEVQIPLADGSANAVFVPESVAEAAGGSSYMGSFTPTENVSEVTIEIPGEFDNFLFYQETLITDAGVRFQYGGLIVNDQMVFSIGSNSSGSGVTSTYAANENGDTSRFNLTNNNDGTYTLAVSPTVSASGYLLPTKYVWQAWKSPLA